MPNKKRFYSCGKGSCFLWSHIHNGNQAINELITSIFETLLTSFKTLNTIFRKITTKSLCKSKDCKCVEIDFDEQPTRVSPGQMVRADNCVTITETLLVYVIFEKLIFKTYIEIGS